MSKQSMISFLTFVGGGSAGLLAYWRLRSDGGGVSLWFVIFVFVPMVIAVFFVSIRDSDDPFNRKDDG